MTYSLAARPSRAMTVGSAAQHDPVLANASLRASQLLLKAARKPVDVRRRFISNSLDAIAPGMAHHVNRMYQEIVSSGKGNDQSLFDAIRLAIANFKRGEGIESLRMDAARIHGAEALGAFSANDRATACSIASGASTVGGVASVIPVYGQIVGGVLSIGSAIAGGELDCGRESREAAAAAAQAQANLQMAQAAATAQASANQANARSAQIRLYLMGGSAVVATLGVGYFLLK